MITPAEQIRPVQPLLAKNETTQLKAWKSRLVEKISYIVTTIGVPLRIEGSGGPTSDAASVDSELTLLYSDLKGGRPHALPGGIFNPFFGEREAPFNHSRHPIYLVTRLAGYDWNDIRGLIDRALVARNRGQIVIDASDDSDGAGNDWLRTAALLVPRDRLIFDETPRVLYDLHDVIAYASWGSNDHNRTRRRLGFTWLPGAIMTEYVSTNGRTFARSPDNWNFTRWTDREHFFAGSPQSLTADYIHEGVTGASGHVWEPYLSNTPHPDRLLAAYLRGRNLAESFWLSIPNLSWQNIVVGDPLCRLEPVDAPAKK